MNCSALTKTSSHSIVICILPGRAENSGHRQRMAGSYEEYLPHHVDDSSRSLRLCRLEERVSHRYETLPVCSFLGYLSPTFSRLSVISS